MSGQDISVLITIGVIFVTLARYIVTMKEQIKTLFNKDRARENELKELRESVLNLHTAFKDSQSNLSSMIKDQYIKIIEKIDEKISR